jgi:hypothetical protein
LTVDDESVSMGSMKQNPWRNRLAAYCIALLWLASPGHAHAEELTYRALSDEGKLKGGFVQAELHGSLLSDAADKSLLQGTFGYGFRGGWRWSGWGAFLHVEQNLWLSTELENEVVYGVINVGVGGEYTYANGFVRTSVTAGPSILAFDTVLDKAGTTGFFLDFRPVGLRWTVHERIVLGVDPLTFTIVAPVLSGIPLVNVEFRAAFYMETDF